MQIQVTAGVLAVLVLAACDGGGSAVETRERAAVEPVALKLNDDAGRRDRSRDA